MLPLSGCDHHLTKRTVAMTNSPSQCSGHVKFVSVDTEWCEYCCCISYWCILWWYVFFGWLFVLFCFFFKKGLWISKVWSRQKWSTLELSSSLVTFRLRFWKDLETVSEVQWNVFLHCLHPSDVMQYEGLVHLKGMYALVDCKLLSATFCWNDSFFFLAHFCLMHTHFWWRTWEIIMWEHRICIVNVKVSLCYF